MMDCKFLLMCSHMSLFKFMFLLNMVSACAMLLYQNHSFIIIIMIVQSHL